MKLFQRAKSGRVKFIELFTQGDTLISKWGLLESDKIQETKKVCLPKNVGKANALTAEEQAVAEMDAKLTKKKNEGYVEDLDAIHETSVIPIELDDLPREFCVCKPISKAPAKILKDPDTYGQQKRDGHCIILVKTETGKGLVYSRGMENITDYMSFIPEVVEVHDHMHNGTMLLTEFCFVKNNGKESTREIAKLVRKKDVTEVSKRYLESKTKGKFEIAPFDIMYASNNFVGDLAYRERHALLVGLGYQNVPEILESWNDYIESAKTNGWEGFILRNDAKSEIHYSLNGKADRAGSYKYIFTHNDDFIVTSVERGKSGKHAGMYSQFFLSQYNQEGGLLDLGKCGPGKIAHEDLAQMTKDIDDEVLKLPFVIQVEFRDQHPDSGKLVFPVFERIRLDKKPEECITDFVPED